VSEATQSSHKVKQRLMPADHPWDWSVPTPYSQGWRCGDFIFVGGQISSDRDARTVGAGDIEMQTRNVMNMVKKVLNEAGADIEDIVKLNTYYRYPDGKLEGEAEREFWEKMNAVRLEFFKKDGPCGTGVRVEGFAYPDLLIEIEAIAYKPLED
jgi:2-iminobutanoate/2-iminopropanoate deaminase